MSGPPSPSTSLELQLYGHILSIVLGVLGKLELLVQDLPKPRSLWELELEVQVKSGAGALNVDQDIVQELTKAFWEPSLTSKVTVPSPSFKVPEDVYTALFKSPKVEEDMVKQVGNIHSLAINPDFHRALETSYEASMVSLWLVWHATVMINYLHAAQ